MLSRAPELSIHAGRFCARHTATGGPDNLATRMVTAASVPILTPRPRLADLREAGSRASAPALVRSGPPVARAAHPPAARPLAEEACRPARPARAQTAASIGARWAYRPRVCRYVSCWGSCGRRDSGQVGFRLAAPDSRLSLSLSLSLSHTHTHSLTLTHTLSDLSLSVLSPTLSLSLSL